MRRRPTPGRGSAGCRPQITPDVPPPWSDQASPASASVVPAPAPASAADRAAARTRPGCRAACRSRGRRRRRPSPSGRARRPARRSPRPSARAGRRPRSPPRRDSALAGGIVCCAACGRAGVDALPLRDRAAPERGRVRGRGPEPLQLVVQPEQRQRAPGHVEARAELADLGIDDLDAGGAEQPVDAAVDDEQLLVLDACPGR